MRFSFGFFEEQSKTAICSGTAESAMNSSVDNVTATEHFPLEIFQNGGEIVFTTLQVGDTQFNKVVIEADETALDKESDIIPGVYEGGYKVWECSVDLAIFILQRKCPLPLEGTGRVVELGCGHGFPGIAALKTGYQKVLFSDLNAEVIDQATWPNVFLNCRDTMAGVRCYSGDWDALSATLLNSGDGDDGDEKFELILSAETLYTEASCRKLLAMVMRHLAAAGIALIASKRFYFGVGGGTYTLEMLVQEAGVLQYDVLQVYEDGQSNIREIVRLSFK